VIIHDFNTVWPGISPNKTDTVSVVDSDAVLAFAIACKGFQPVAWGHTKFLQ